MQGSMTAPAAINDRASIDSKQRQFLNAYWLRPENAFWMVLRSNVLARAPMRGPVLDLGCGDGVFSFLHAGGQFSHAFDVFSAVKDLERVLDDHADVFDHIEDDYDPKITEKPAYTIDCGTDLKGNLLAKASKLGMYDRLVHHDHNERLPFADGEFQTVYCNTAYWVDDIDGFLREIARVTAPGGTAVLQVKLDAIKQFTMQKHRELLGDRWLDIMDRGRLGSWPTLSDRATWEARFASAGLKIADATPFVTGTHAHVWDIGLRPIAPMLIKTMNAIHLHLRQEIKRDWVDLFSQLLAPFCKPDMDLFTEPNEPVEIQYVLTPGGV